MNELASTWRIKKNGSGSVIICIKYLMEYVKVDESKTREICASDPHLDKEFIPTLN